MKKVKWGIVSTGFISNCFATCAPFSEYGEVVAVASRNGETGRAFAEKHSIPLVYTGYEEMLADGKVDAVYIGTPHTLHADNARLFLEAGIPVVCEKPLGVNLRQTGGLCELARSKKVFLMEAMWTRCFPAMKKAEEWIAEGRIGEPICMFASFGDHNPDRNAWRYKNSMAGGALLDVGIYPLALALRLFGRDPLSVSGEAKVVNGIDECNTFLLKYEDGKTAVLSSALAVKMINGVVINGNKGTMIIGSNEEWWRAKDVTIRYYENNKYTGKTDTFFEEFPSEGYQYEIDCASKHILAGELEADEMPLDDSLAMAKIMDKLRSDWGMVYPQDI